MGPAPDPGSLTIGAFARVSRLSAKALRRYDELGLLRPARVDAYTGYRYYEETQLDRARLVAWLRRIGMPLARIRYVCDLRETDADAAARDIGAYWIQVEAETAARRDLATFLIGHLSGNPAGKDVTAMSSSELPSTSSSPSSSISSSPSTVTSSSASSPAARLGLRYAARSDRGLVRETNQDTAYAGARLLAVADGYGREGAPASEAAVEVLKSLPGTGPEARDGDDLLSTLAEAVEEANRAVDGFVDSGTTLTALLWTSSRLALVHVGDTRAYLLRDGEFFQITHDHTVVQSMIDAGGLSPEEAASHPQRAMLLRALDGSEEMARPELRVHDVRAADRYLLCSDGLFTAVDADVIRGTVAAAAGPEPAVRELIELARHAGGADNIACVVADVVPL
ncbi:MerR family transcriptional regulator [Streptomyces sp. NPDC059255]|uniref:MerR family transcriptional regulator n=1 Tax=Streptomyces sp. NPDC059255 TaxID=3346793 RepID=UPI00369C01F5